MCVAMEILMKRKGLDRNRDSLSLQYTFLYIYIERRMQNLPTHLSSNLDSYLIIIQRHLDTDRKENRKQKKGKFLLQLRMETDCSCHPVFTKMSR